MDRMCREEELGIRSDSCRPSPVSVGLCASHLAFARAGGGSCLAEVGQLMSESFPSLGAAPFLVCPVSGESRLLLPRWAV